MLSGSILTVSILSVALLSVTLRVKMYYDECHFSKCRTECFYKHRHAVWHYAGVIRISVILQWYNAQCYYSGHRYTECYYPEPEYYGLLCWMSNAVWLCTESHLRLIVVMVGVMLSVVMLGGATLTIIIHNAVPIRWVLLYHLSFFQVSLDRMLCCLFKPRSFTNCAAFDSKIDFNRIFSSTKYS